MSALNVVGYPYSSAEVRWMRGESRGQHDAFSYVGLEERIPPDHPLRAIRARADAALKRPSQLFEQMYAKGGHTTAVGAT
jgi:hypothetical protein